MSDLESGLGRDPFRLVERSPTEQAIRALRAIVESFDRDNGTSAGVLAMHAGVALDAIAESKPALDMPAGPPRPAEPSEIWTGSGFLDLAAPQGFMIGSVVEIATSLSRLARFNGGGPRFYSVAEHSILCDEIARTDEVPAMFRRAVLMHDAAEAYVGDVVRPLKRMLPGFAAIEAGVARAIAERFDIPIGYGVAAYDDLALAIEKREFFPDSGSWGDLPDPGVWQAPRLGRDAAALEFVRRAEALGIR